MRTLKTKLPDHIASFDQAKEYLINLYNNGESYHPEDSAAECFEGISEADAAQMDTLMIRVYIHFTDHDADPCKFLLDLSGHIMEG